MRESAIIETYLDQTLTSPGGGPLPPAPFHVFGTVTPDGPTDWDELRLKQQVTLGHLAAMKTSAEPAYAIGPIQSWVEPVVFARGICDGSALSFALDCLLEFHVAVRADGVEVSALLGDMPPERVTSALVHGGIAVAGIEVRRRSLEQLFVGLTGEGFDVAR